MNTSSVSRFNALRASVSNVVQLPLPIEGFPGEKQGNGKGSNDKGWNYLLSNTVSFSKSVDHAIRIQKPEKEKPEHPGRTNELFSFSEGQTRKESI